MLNCDLALDRVRTAKPTEFSSPLSKATDCPGWSTPSISSPERRAAPLMSDATGEGSSLLPPRRAGMKGPAAWRSGASRRGSHND